MAKFQFSVCSWSDQNLFSCTIWPIFIGLGWLFPLCTYSMFLAFSYGFSIFLFPPINHSFIYFFSTNWPLNFSVNSTSSNCHLSSSEWAADLRMVRSRNTHLSVFRRCPTRQLAWIWMEKTDRLNDQPIVDFWPVRKINGYSGILWSETGHILIIYFMADWSIIWSSLMSFHITNPFTILQLIFCPLNPVRSIPVWSCFSLHLRVLLHLVAQWAEADQLDRLRGEVQRLLDQWWLGDQWSPFPFPPSLSDHLFALTIAQVQIEQFSAEPQHHTVVVALVIQAELVEIAVLKGLKANDGGERGGGEEEDEEEGD